VPRLVALLNASPRVSLCSHSNCDRVSHPVVDRLWNADVLASSNPDAHSDADDNVHANSVWFVRPCYGDIDADDDCDSDTKLESVRKPVCVHVGIAVSDGVYGNADSNE
jgi:hypothetical protein